MCVCVCVCVCVININHFFFSFQEFALGRNELIEEVHQAARVSFDFFLIIFFPQSTILFNSFFFPQPLQEAMMEDSEEESEPEPDNPKLHFQMSDLVDLTLHCHYQTRP